MKNIEIQKRLKYLKEQIEKECISYGEIAELQNLAKYIDPSDTQLLEWAGVEEGNITSQYILEQVKAHKDHLCYNRQFFIQELQLDNKNGETEATLELYYTNDGHVYSIIYTNELTGNTREITGKECEDLSMELLSGNNPLMENL